MYRQDGTRARFLSRFSFRKVACRLVVSSLACLTIIASEYQTNAQIPEPVTQREFQVGEDDLVHYGDVVDVDIVGGFEFDWRGTLTSDGFLDGLDGYSEQIYGLCRSESAIAADVVRVLGRILRDPKVVVKIIDRSNRAVVRMDGAVRTATRFRLRRTVFLRELLVMAGGFTDGASGEISIFRPKALSCLPSATMGGGVSPQTVGERDNGSPISVIKISDLLSGKKEADPQILSGDIITVTLAQPIYVIGAVNNPNPIYTRDKMTLTRVVASAGGLAKNADGNKVSIYRRVGTTVQTIDADLGKIKRKESEDEILQAFDIIDIVAKGGMKRKYPPVVANDANKDRKQELPLKVVD